MLTSNPEDIAFLETLAYPEPALVLPTGSTAFPNPLDSQGFILNVATIEGITSARIAKIEAAGFAEG